MISSVAVAVAVAEVAEIVVAEIVAEIVEVVAEVADVVVAVEASVAVVEVSVEVVVAAVVMVLRHTAPNFEPVMNIARESSGRPTIQRARETDGSITNRGCEIKWAKD